MKRLSTIIMALALVLGMSQCKKQETPTTGNTTNPGVHITVNVGDQDGKDNNGEKHNIAPQYGLFAFSSGDKLYVGHGGRFAGTLTFNNGFFSGTIYPDQNVTDQPLHFYFVGNAAVTGTPVAEQTTSLSINIANQSTNLPVLSYGASTKPFTGTGTTYSTTLRNKCALVRFDLQNPGDYEVTLSGVPTLATVNFANPTAETAIVATANQTNGNITLYGESGNTLYRWAILLPGTNLDNAQGLTIGSTVEDHEMGYNTYINSGISINNSLPAPDAEYAVKTSDGTLTQFSVSANKKVYFSRGNLKADFTSGGYAEGWSFHDTQFGEVAGPTMSDNPNNKYYYLHEQSNSNSNNPAGPGINFINHQNYGDRFTWGYFSSITLATKEYVHSEEDLSKTAAVAKDWGCVFTESSPEGGNWRTLSANEWIYLFNGATTGTSNAVRGDKRFLRVRMSNFNVNPVDDRFNEEYWGVFVFPDQYQDSNLTGTYTFNSDTPTQIDYSNADVAQMLNDGAVFLPCVGYRYSDWYYDYVCYSLGYQIGAGIGYYWSSTHIDGTTNYAKGLKFVVRGYSPNSTTGVSIVDLPRDYGYCVRLVWDAN